MDLLYLLIPRTFPAFRSAIFKNLLIPPQCYRWMQQLQVRHLHAKHVHNQEGRAGASIHRPYLSPLSRRNIFPKVPSLIPFICHWPILVHMVSLVGRKVGKYIPGIFSLSPSCCIWPIREDRWLCVCNHQCQL